MAQSRDYRVARRIKQLARAADGRISSSIRRANGGEILDRSDRNRAAAYAPESVTCVPGHGVGQPRKRVRTQITRQVELAVYEHK